MRPADPIEQIDPTRLSDRVLSFELAHAYARICSSKYVNQPLTYGVCPSRFSDPSLVYGVMYLAETTCTAFVESVVRQYPRTPGWRLSRAALSSRVVFDYGSDGRLDLLDLRGDGCLVIGSDLSVLHSPDHRYGQALSAALHHQRPDVHGILYPSWHTSENCIALYDNGVRLLRCRRTTYLHQHRPLHDYIRRYRIPTRP